jgi:hypothetical protein
MLAWIGLWWYFISRSLWKTDDAREGLKPICIAYDEHCGQDFGRPMTPVRD